MIKRALIFGEGRINILLLIILFYVVGHLPFMFAPFVNLESWYAGAADLVSQGKVIAAAHFFEVTIANPISSVFGIIPFYKLFGITEFSARLFSLFCGGFAILITYVMGKRYFSEHVAILASLLVCFNPVFWLFSGLVFTDAPFFFASSLAMFLFFFALEKDSFLLHFVSGIIFGLSFLLKMNAATFVPAIFIICILHVFSKRENLQEKFLSIAKLTFLYAAAIGVIFLPYIVWSFGNLGYLIPPAYQQGVGLTMPALFSNFLLKFSNFWGYVLWIGIFSGPIFLVIYYDLFKQFGVKKVLIYSIAGLILSFVLTFYMRESGELNLGWLKFFFNEIELFIISGILHFVGLLVVFGFFIQGIKSKSIVRYLAVWFFVVIISHSFVKVAAQRYLLFILLPLNLYLAKIVMQNMTNHLLRVVNYFIIVGSFIIFISLDVFNSAYFAAEGYAAADLAHFINKEQLKGIDPHPNHGANPHSGYLINKDLYVEGDERPKYITIIAGRKQRIDNMIKDFGVKPFGIIIKRFVIIKNVE
ncbi:MAG: glycosyltransferase family 39 protein [Candidatus Margulisbacteria bacterium]|nr:glycosyltransferase family 39 protein [Candidatus Margulisiibacteriota bacterium]MBU1022120.1 glycosyltransferase family 39 protein [Candidatus Margulisiibacteriota bacterium]MBU1728636.1 glycosyltransferase family 39 protein [Candidatus Margulisiibacteriota bacterium]MBU1955087.1 glycosyltransferase family 39 protein [Candidatus Margulisiibacteriota bacterium]